MKTRIITGWVMLLLALLVWIPGSDVIGLVIREKEVLLGRYSQGHFATLFFLDILLVMQAVLLLVPMKSRADRIFASIMVPVSSGLALFLVLVVSGWMYQPRYIEKLAAATEAGRAKKLQGLVRHRPPNEHYEFTWTDAPEMPRSYPGRPHGYGSVPIVLTSDRYGFRNTGTLLEEYPVLVVGDSFAAGSHVSDDQAWTVLLSHAIGQPIYNLGVSGSSPRVYLNNYVVLGQRFHPKTVLMVIYEGNDFRYEPPLKIDKRTGEEKRSLGQQILFWGKASPVTRGLKRLSSEVFQKIGADAAIPGYAEAMGWMPLKVTTPRGDQYYSFPPKRLKYLSVTPERFAKSPDWTSIRDILLEMKQLSQEDGFRLILVYAPSTPHVVMPLVADSIPAGQLRNFLSYEMDDLPDAASLKSFVLQNLGSQQAVFLHFCEQSGIECVSMTSALRAAVARGEQVYYTYDQHWTPLGNRVAAAVLANYLSGHPTSE